MFAYMYMFTREFFFFAMTRLKSPQTPCRIKQLHQLTKFSAQPFQCPYTNYYIAVLRYNNENFFTAKPDSEVHLNQIIYTRHIKSSANSSVGVQILFELVSTLFSTFQV